MGNLIYIRTKEVIRYVDVYAVEKKTCRIKKILPNFYHMKHLEFINSPMGRLIAETRSRMEQEMVIGRHD